MKLRILGNSIRLRLSQGDIQTLESDRELLASVDFPDSTFHYGIRITTEPALTATYENDALLVLIPAATAGPWLTTAQVGISHTLRRSGMDDLEILLEKDFACLIPREGEEDMFPNPRAQQEE